MYPIINLEYTELYIPRNTIVFNTMKPMHLNVKS